jgi:hypothetical protein
MDEGETPKSKVIRLPRSLDANGRLLRKDGPCYICDQPTAYRYSGYHGKYGDAWIDRQFNPAVRASQSERLKRGAFLRRREQGQNTLRQLLKFVCRPCLDDMEHRLWPEAEDRERADAEKRVPELRMIEAQRHPPRPDYDVRMVMLNEREIEIRCGDCLIGMIDFDSRSSRLRVILGDAYLGTELPHIWTGGPAAVEIDLQEGIDEIRGSQGSVR